MAISAEDGAIVREELLTVTGITPKKGETENDLALRVARHINDSMDEEEYGQMSEGAVAWYEKAVTDIGKKKQIALPQEAEEEEPDEDEGGEDDEQEAEEVEAEADESDETEGEEVTDDDEDTGEEEVQEEAPKKRGRPKVALKAAAKKRGRPPGSKNKATVEKAPAKKAVPKKFPAKKAASPKKEKATTGRRSNGDLTSTKFAMELVCKKPEITLPAVAQALQDKGYEPLKHLTAVYYRTKAVIRTLQEMGKM